MKKIIKLFVAAFGYVLNTGFHSEKHRREAVFENGDRSSPEQIFEGSDVDPPEKLIQLPQKLQCRSFCFFFLVGIICKPCSFHEAQAKKEEEPSRGGSDSPKKWTWVFHGQDSLDRCFLRDYQDQVQQGRTFLPSLWLLRK